uniref:Uncharacterized protein n=1 Tax=Arundo donax TaxID=35708 RepID=A0A0A9EZ45_ARUDO
MIPSRPPGLRLSTEYGRSSGSEWRDWERDSYPNGSEQRQGRTPAALTKLSAMRLRRG